jgi:arylsulfatase A
VRLIANNFHKKMLKLQLLSLLFFAGLCFVGCSESEHKKDERNFHPSPNIIILFCDDLGYGDLGITGHPSIRTPNLDRMAMEGMRLSNFYSGSPACTASRYALLTGKYPARSGFDWVLYPKSPRGIHPKEITLAESLKQAGYATACYGKWHLGSTKKEYLPLQNGFDEYLGLPYSNDMLPPKWPDIPLLEGNDTLELNPDQGKLTRLYTKRSIQFIEKNKDQPFFIYLPYAMPHVPLYASEKFSGRSKRGTYGDVVEEIDWSVGEILKTLENKQLDQNTLVFFTSDNGPWIIKGLEGGSAGLFRDGKGSTWEGGMRVPAIARWPGQIPAGSVNQSPVSVIDLFATFNNLAGVDSSKDHLADGQSLPSVLLQNETVAENRFLFFYGWRNELTAVRRGPWKLHIKTYSQTGIDYFDGQLPLLFNLNEDPSETQNVADQHPELVRQLQLAIEEHKAEVKQQASFFDQ